MPEEQSKRLNAQYSFKKLNNESLCSTGLSLS